MRYGLVFFICALSACAIPPKPKKVLSYRQVIHVVTQPPHQHEVATCAGPSTNNQTPVSGDVHVSFYINADGRALKSGVVKNSTGVIPLSECVLGVLRSWEFPSSDESTMFAVFYKFGPGGLQIRFPFMPERQ